MAGEATLQSHPRRTAWLYIAGMAALLCLPVAPAAQPAAPATPDLPCSSPPPDGTADTVASERSPAGYYSLFDGASFMGWWQSCQSAHGGPAVFRISSAEKAIYSTQKGTTGGLLM